MRKTKLTVVKAIDRIYKKNTGGLWDMPYSVWKRMSIAELENELQKAKNKYGEEA